MSATFNNLDYTHLQEIFDAIYDAQSRTDAEALDNEMLPYVSNAVVYDVSNDDIIAAYQDVPQ